jgi:hypothetical protein
MTAAREVEVQVGQVYEAWSAAPGYPPMRWQVYKLDGQGWCWVKQPHNPDAAESPMRQSTLLASALYHRIDES